MVFASLVFSLAIVLLAEVIQHDTLKTMKAVLGLYALFFPVGWGLMMALFPRREQLSLLSRALFSVALSVAVNNIALQVFFYVFQGGLGVVTNSIILLFFGAVFFIAWIAREKGLLK